MTKTTSTAPLEVSPYIHCMPSSSTSSSEVRTTSWESLRSTHWNTELVFVALGAFSAWLESSQRWNCHLAVFRTRWKGFAVRVVMYPTDRCFVGPTNDTSPPRRMGTWH